MARPAQVHLVLYSARAFQHSLQIFHCRGRIWYSGPPPLGAWPTCCTLLLWQVARNNLLPAVFGDDGGKESWNICEEGDEGDEGDENDEGEEGDAGENSKKWRPPAWRKATDEEMARFHNVPLPPKGTRLVTPVLDLTPDPLERVSVTQLLRKAGEVCVTNSLLRFEPCDPPAEWAGGPAPPTYKAVWSD